MPWRSIEAMALYRNSEQGAVIVILIYAVISMAIAEYLRKIGRYKSKRNLETFLSEHGTTLRINRSN